MTGPGRFAGLFAAIDAADVDAFMGWLTQDCSFVYGSSEPVRGADAVRALVAGFLASFRRVTHRVDSSWEADDAGVTEGLVTYITADGREVTLPFCNVFHLAADGRIRDYRIYIDPTPLG
ncbi:MAG TPA: nuclear transport factor 2 family protein [Candidatus Sulfomarinibacteraceae bacterium]|nr:nuclear transport factor 2 family protein [Candidatus Sulfomarinibacteraceae bacterium]